REVSLFFLVPELELREVHAVRAGVERLDDAIPKLRAERVRLHVATRRNQQDAAVLESIHSSRSCSQRGDGRQGCSYTSVPMQSRHRARGVAASPA
ncbi:MAG: hypothetical protein RLZZ246_1190, partial [Planctomycetota bacterium]